MCIITPYHLCVEHAQSAHSSYDCIHHPLSYLTLVHNNKNQSVNNPSLASVH